MDSKFVPAQFRSAVLVVVMVVAPSVVPFHARAQAVSLDPAKMPRVGNLDARFVSYNIEMAEVTGGNFWKPYHNQKSAAAEATQHAQSASIPAGMSPNLYQYRPPIDLANPQLRKLASALGPAYVRVSGTGANSVCFADSDSPRATAKQLEGTTIELNRKPLQLTSGGDLPLFKGETFKAGRVRLSPTSITFLSVSDAGNANCQ